MSKTVDTRVVEMEFDNATFKSKVEDTINLLTKFKESLKFQGATEGIDSIEKAANNFDMSSMNNNIESVKVNFSALQVVGATVLANLTNTAVEAGKKIFSALTSSLVQGGITRALNLEQAQFQLKGLGVAWEDVKGDIDYAVDGTAYGLDVAAKAASQLSASGIAVGDNMKSALRGISGVAAMTNSSYEDIAEVFTTVAGNGRLMGSELTRLGARGINAAAALATYLNKTETEVRDMTSKGEIDFQTFADAMDSAFGEHAKAANETFSGALANMKAALARIGAEVATPALQNLRDIFNALRVSINNAKVALTPFIEAINRVQTAAAATFVEFVNLKGLDALGTAVLNVFKALYSIIKPIKEALSEIFPSVAMTQVIDFTIAVRNFTASLSISNKVAENIKNTFRGIFTVVKSVLDILLNVASVVGKTVYTIFTTVFGNLADIILTITGNLGNFIVLTKQWIDQFISLQSVQDLIQTLSNIFNGLLSAISSAGNAVRVFVENVLNISFTSVFKVFDKLASVFYKIASAIDNVIQKVKEFVAQQLVKPEVQEQIDRIKTSFDEFKDVIVAVYENIVSKLINAFTRMKDSLSSVISKVKEFLSQYIEIPSAQEIFKNAITFLADTIDNVSAILDSAKEGFGNFIDKIKELAGISFDKTISNFNEFKTSVINALDIGGKVDSAKEFIQKFASGTSEAMTGVSGVIEKIKNALSSLVNFIKDKLSSITLGDALAAGVGVSVIAFLLQMTSIANKLADSISAFVGIGEKVNELLESLTGAVESFGKVVNAKAMAIRLDAIKGIITSIALLAGSIALLAAMDIDKVRESAIIVGVLSTLIIGLSALFATLSKNFNPVDVAKSTTSMLSVSGAVLILAVSLKTLASIDSEKIASSLVALGVLMLEMSALMVIISKTTASFKGGEFAVLGLSVSILILSKALVSIGDIDSSSLLKSVTVISTMMIILSLISSALGKGKATLSTSILLISVAVSVKMLISALKSLADMDVASLQSGLMGIIEILGVVSVLMLAARVAGKYAAEAGVFILAVSAALLLMIQVINQFADIDSSTIKKASESISQISVIFALLIVSTSFAGQNAVKAGAAILMISAAMIGLSAAILIISRVEPDKLNNAVEAITTLGVMFALLIGMTSLAKSADKTIKYLAITITALTALLLVASMIEPDNLLSAGLAISMIEAMLALLIASTGKAKNAYTAVLSISLVMVALGGVLYVLANYTNVDDVLSIATGLSELILVLTASVAILGRLPKGSIMSGIEGIGLMDILLVDLGALLVLFGGLNEVFPQMKEFLDQGIPILESIGYALGSLFGNIIAGVVNAMSKTIPVLGQSLSDFASNVNDFVTWAKTIDQSALDGVVIFTEMMALMGASSLISYLTSFARVQGLKSQIEFFEALPDMGKSMKEFSETMDGVNVDRLYTAADAAKAFSEIYANLPDTDYGDNFVSIKNAIFGNKESLSQFAEDIENLVNAMKRIDDAISGEEDVFNPEKFQRIKDCAMMFVDLQLSIGSTGGFAQLFAGVQDLGDFGQQIATFSEEFIKANEGVSKIESVSSNWDLLLPIVEKLSALQGSLQNSGGMLQWLAGAKDLGTGFGTQIATFADEIVKANDSINRIESFNVDKWDSIIVVAGKLSELQSSLENSGGMFQWLAGAKDLGTGFGTQIATFATEMAKANDSVNNMGSVDVTKWESISSAVTPLIDITKQLENSGGALQWWAGEKNLGEFGNRIAEFGAGLASFSTAITDAGGINISTFEQAVQASQLIIELANSLGAVGETQNPIIKFFTGEENPLSVFSTRLVEFGYKIQEFSNVVGGANIESMNASITFATSMVDLCTRVQEQGDISTTITTFCQNISQYGLAIKGFFSGLSEINFSVADQISEALNKVLEFGTLSVTYINVDFYSSFKSALERVAQDGFAGFINVVTVQTTYVLSIIQVFMTNVTTVFTNGLVTLKSVLTTQGTLAMRALANAITSGSGTVVNAIRSMTSRCVSAVSSMSSSFYSEGANVAIGYAQGIQAYSSRAISAAQSMASTVKSIVKSVNDSNSPSKEFYKEGFNVDQGYAKGIETYAYLPEKSIMDMGNTTLLAFQSLLNNAAEIAEDNLVYEPVIRPVIDLTNVESNASRLNSMFIDLPVSSVISQTSSSIPIQNGSRSGTINDLNSNIRNLSSKIDKLNPGPTLNINGAQINRKEEILDTIYDLFGELQALGEL